MTALLKSKTYTPEEYLVFEERAKYRSEYVNGSVFKMAGGTEAHNDITLNVAAQLKMKLRRKCKTYANDMKVWVEEIGTFFHPDMTVVCGERKFHKGRCDIVENPILLIEVLSHSTDKYDKNDKFLLVNALNPFKNTF